MGRDNRRCIAVDTSAVASAGGDAGGDAGGAATALLIPVGFTPGPNWHITRGRTAGSGAGTGVATAVVLNIPIVTASAATPERRIPDER